MTGETNTLEQDSKCGGDPALFSKI